MDEELIERRTVTTDIEARLTMTVISIIKLISGVVQEPHRPGGLPPRPEPE